MAQDDNDAQVRFRHDVAALLRAARPETALAIAPRDDPTVTSLRATFDSCSWHTAQVVDSLEALEITERFDFGVVLDTLERIGVPLGNALLARLRDVTTRQFCVGVNEGDNPQTGVPRWSDNQLAALGLRRVGRYGEDSAALNLYHYDVASYKPVPDWLNARHWANPQRWDKQRW